MLCFFKRVIDICFINKCGCEAYVPDQPDEDDNFIGVVNNGIQVVHNGNIVINGVL